MSRQPMPLPIGYIGYWTDVGGVVHQTREMAPGESRMVGGLSMICGCVVAIFEDCVESSVPTCLWCVGHVDRVAVRLPNGCVVAP